MFFAGVLRRRPSLFLCILRRRLCRRASPKLPFLLTFAPCATISSPNCRLLLIKHRYFAASSPKPPTSANKRLLPGGVVLHGARPASEAFILAAASGPSSCPRQTPRVINSYVCHLWPLSFWPRLPLFRNAAAQLSRDFLNFPDHQSRTERHGLEGRHESAKSKKLGIFGFHQAKIAPKACFLAAKVKNCSIFSFRSHPRVLSISFVSSRLRPPPLIS